jgi:hypothetical protein
MYDELRRYGDIIADKNHETTEGHFIRFTTYKFEDRYYVVVMFDGIVLMVAEKEDIREFIAEEPKLEDVYADMSAEEIERITSDGYNPHL